MDDHFIVTIERLRDDVTELKAVLRKKYKAPSKQVVASDIRNTAATLAETWMVDIIPRLESAPLVSQDYVGDLNIHFQRLLTFSEHATKRSKYDSELAVILKDITLKLIIPLKQAISHGVITQFAPPPVVQSPNSTQSFQPTAFVGHSFWRADDSVSTSIIDCLETIGFSVETGSKPKADKISDKVKKLIDQQFLFVGVFTKRDKLARKKEWTTSPWVIDEKAYAVAKKKKLLLIKEAEVVSIGGIQGDYEYIEFNRENLQILLLKILQTVQVDLVGLR